MKKRRWRLAIDLHLRPYYGQAQQRGEELYLQLPADRLAAILKRLRMFVLRSQVTLDEVSDDVMRFGLSGECAETLLENAPATPWETVTQRPSKVATAAAARSRPWKPLSTGVSGG